MSHSHIRVPKAVLPPKPQYVFCAFLGCVLIAVIAVYLWSNLRAAGFWERHSAAEGKVSETRVVVDHMVGGTYGGVIYYRLEAHVSFIAEGHTQDRWLVVQEDTAERLMLMAKAATNPRGCEVYWVPGHRENAKCLLE